MMIFGLFPGCSERSRGATTPQAQLLSCSEEDPFLLLESPIHPAGMACPSGLTGPGQWGLR